MSRHELINRLQRACQRGESLRKMAETEQLPLDTVRQITSTPRFQVDLLMHLVNTSLTRSKPSPRMDRLTGRAVTRLLKLMKSGANVPLSVQDLLALGTFSQQQYALGLAQLAPELQQNKVGEDLQPF